ncbi:LAME_0F15973g1_1 [Lachancea meyersii CBS 8951]|uniref:LAME_0F15973g1_1 n=1 Tax=Lachancea meyersii CBS 8951 TaxID=1266667 RepID=A0A1G4JYS5_9SACH|nr:LAME_0F15973g1_1 [Lachancea meyersii CBS 8951]
MITDEQLNTLAISFGVIMVTLIVVYHAILSSTTRSDIKKA